MTRCQLRSRRVDRQAAETRSKPAIFSAAPWRSACSDTLGVQEMQSVAWYVRRLRAMSASEIGWRVKSAIRDATDPYRIRFQLYPRTANTASVALGGAPRWCPVPLGDWRDLAPDDPETRWRSRLIDRADAIVAHRLSFFDLENADLGHPIDWHRDYSSGHTNPRTRLKFSPSIDYRDHVKVGDAKVVWEPNRHHQLVLLGRAYRATGNTRYAAAIVEQLESWIDDCPYGFGMNWRSPLELAVRLVNWVWAVDLIADSSALTPALTARLFRTVALHVWDIARKYSRGSSA